MVLAVPVTVAGLHLASALAINSRVSNDILKRQYAAMGAAEYSLFRLVYESGYAQGLGGSTDTYQVSLNGQTVTVTTTVPPNSGTGPSLPDTDSSRRLAALKTVSPQSAAANSLTVYSYHITVENRDDQTERVNKIMDTLPAGFTYITGSTSGVTIADPAITCCAGNSGAQLTWNLGNLQINLLPGQTATLDFQASAQVAQGVYCNEVHVDPGGTKTSSGPTANIVVGSPASNLCPQPAVKLTKSVTPAYVSSGSTVQVTYTISVENRSAASLSIKKVTDLLPEGLTYVASTTSGTITSAEPSSSMQGGEQRLIWSFSPDYILLPGQTATVIFAATGTLEAGIFWNQVWIDVGETAFDVYSWPTAPVEAMRTIESQVQVNGTSTSLSWQLWLGEVSHSINKWHLKN
ncbi:MAG: hypothetical protein O2976_05965 [Actinomycetota bacterium]|nr:hypothetical protein [Actinomycetota bacterium]